MCKPSYLTFITIIRLFEHIGRNHRSIAKDADGNPSVECSQKFEFNNRNTDVYPKIFIQKPFVPRLKPNGIVEISFTLYILSRVGDQNPDTAKYRTEEVLKNLELSKCQHILQSVYYLLVQKLKDSEISVVNEPTGVTVEEFFNDNTVGVGYDLTLSGRFPHYYCDTLFEDGFNVNEFCNPQYY